MGLAEGYVENYLRQQATTHNCLCYKFTSPGTNGVPDEILIHNGYTMFIETKSPTGSLRDIQKERIKQMKQHGADVRICHTRQSIDKALADIIPNYKPGNYKQPSKPQQNKTKTTVQAIQPCLTSIRIDE